MTDDQTLERRSAQALIATYMQMTRYAQLAKHLQQAREQSTARRIQAATEPSQTGELRRQLDAQQSQSAVLEQAVERLQSRAKELASFVEAGLDYDHFRELGLESVITPETVQEARRKAGLPAEELQGEAGE
jgi:hypothetical protein